MVLILDFDNTVSDSEIEAQSFRNDYLNDLAHLARLSPAEVFQYAAQREVEVIQHPGQHGWRYGGHIVWPGHVDPFTRLAIIARDLLEERQQFSSGDDRVEAVRNLFQCHYRGSLPVFRPGARETLQALAATAAYIVTHSGAETVVERIRTLGKEADGSCSLEWWLNRVHGDARKDVLTPGFTDVAESLELPGLGRPVMLRRGPYFSTLDALRSHHSVTWGKVLVIGDNFEVDPALPLSLGARIGLFVTPYTPDYEKEFIKGHPRGYLITELPQIPSLISGS